MATFEDSKGRQWVVHCDVGTIARVRRETGCDLAKLLASKEALQELADDPVRLVEVIWSVIEPQAETRSVSPEDFGSSLVGDAIERATDALVEAIIDFFPKRRGNLLRQLVEKTKSLETAISQKIEKQIEGLTVESLTSGS